MDRRNFLRQSLLATSCLMLGKLLSSSKAFATEIIEKLTKNNEEWKKMLTPEQYNVLREEGTERPFTSPLLKEHREGVFACVACGLPLFKSSAKYDSGTGWPSFFEAIPDHISTKTDYKILSARTEYHCAKCDGHQGHVFEDGPKPTGLRYCNNGVALKFVPNDEVAATSSTSEKIVVAGGCFWGVQAVFQHTKGVISAVSGYAGGDAKTAQYEAVGSGKTGHAEAVEVTYDPSKITLDKLLDVYFTVAHNPTELNYQGPDHGTQYRSAVFYNSEEQKKSVAEKIKKLDDGKQFSAPIVTKLEPLNKFYSAEEYHQNYATLHPYNPYIVAHDAPKLVNLQKTFPEIFVK